MVSSLRRGKLDLVVILLLPNLRPKEKYGIVISGLTILTVSIIRGSNQKGDPQFLAQFRNPLPILLTVHKITGHFGIF